MNGCVALRIRTPSSRLETKNYLSQAEVAVILQYVVHNRFKFSTRFTGEDACVSVVGGPPVHPVASTGHRL